MKRTTRRTGTRIGMKSGSRKDEVGSREYEVGSRGYGLTLAILLLAVLLFPAPSAVIAGPAAFQETPITVQEASVTYTFGQQAVFSIQATSSADITALYLYIQSEGNERVEVTPVPAEPGSSVQATFTRDLRLFPFPPFGTVNWWWEVRDAAGHQLTTPPATFRYEDNRLNWFRRTAGPATVYSTVDDPQYMQAALDIAAVSLERISRSLNAPVPEKVDIYLYPSLGDLQAALRMAGRAGWAVRPAPNWGSSWSRSPTTADTWPRWSRESPTNSPTSSSTVWRARRDTGTSRPG
jgi:hypothetical protein